MGGMGPAGVWQAISIKNRNEPRFLKTRKSKVDGPNAQKIRRVKSKKGGL